MMIDSKRDPTRPQPPAFTKMEAQVDIMERQRARKARGGIVPPMMFAEMNKATAGKRRGA